jgi:hypothetical protein
MFCKVFPKKKEEGNGSEDRGVLNTTRFLTAGGTMVKDILIDTRSNITLFKSNIKTNETEIKTTSASWTSYPR